MASGGHFTNENQYFCRYFRLLCEVGPTILRKYLEVRVVNGGFLSLSAFLIDSTIEKQIGILQTRKIIHQYQMDILYPANGIATDLSKWDITLLCTIIKNTFTLPAHGKINLENIRKLRNALSHGNPSMDYTEFASKWQNANTCISDILNLCNDVSFTKEITETIQNIETGSIEIEPTIKLFQEIVANDRSVIDQVTLLSDQVATGNESIKNAVFANTKALADMAANVQKINERIYQNADVVTYATIRRVSRTKNMDEQKPEQTKEIERYDLQCDIYADPHIYSNVPMGAGAQKATRISKIPDKMEIQIDQFQMILDQRRDYVQTAQFQRIVDMMSAHNSVVISGRPGEGKTSAALELMSKYRRSGKCIQIEDPEDVKYLQPNVYDYIFIDDIFGVHELDESRKHLWIPTLHKIQRLLDVGAFKVIIVSSEIVLKQCKHDILPFKLFSNKIVLSSENLRTLDKISILKASIENHGRQLSETDINRCITNCSSDMGFPYMCFLFASVEEYFQEKEAFFRRFLVFEHLLKKLKPDKLWSLWYLWVKGGNCSTETLFQGSQENVRILKTVADQRRHIEFNTDQMMKKVNENLSLLENVFVLQSNGKYTFLHNSIYRSVGLYFANNGFMETVISSSNIDFFMECFRLNVTEGTNTICLSTNEIPWFLERILREITTEKHCREVVVHPCLNNENLQKFFPILKEKVDTLKIFLAEMLLTNHPEANTFLKVVVSKIKCSHIGQIGSKKCKKCLLYIEAYKSACKCANTFALEKLKFVKYDTSFLKYAIISKNIGIVEIVSKRMKGAKELDETTLDSILDDALDIDDHGIFELVCKYLSVKCCVIYRYMYLAAKHKKYNILKHLIKKNSKVSSSDYQKYIDKALSETDDINVYLALVEYGHLPSLQDLFNYVREGRISLCLRIINDLQENDYPDNAVYVNTNFSSSKKSILLKGIDVNRRYWQELGLYKQNSFIDESIEGSNLNKIKTLVEKRIRMKVWDPKETWVKYAACRVLKYSLNIYTFLLQNGYIPDDETLISVVETGSEDLVKKTIEIMKENGILILNTLNIHEFESHLYRCIYRPEVFNLLADFLNAPNLSKFRIVCGVRNDNLSFVKEAVEQLKASKFQRNDLILQLAALEARGNQQISDYLESEEILVADILNESIKTQDSNLVYYIYTVMKKNLSSDDLPDKLNETVLLKTIHELPIYSQLLEKGVIPTMDCLEVVRRYGLKSGLKTIEAIRRHGEWDNTHLNAVFILQKAIHESNMNVAKLIMDERVRVNKFQNVSDLIESAVGVGNFSVYLNLKRHGITTTSACILEAIKWCNIYEFEIIVNDFVSKAKWSLEDHNLCKVIEIAEGIVKQCAEWLMIVRPHQINAALSESLTAIRNGDAGGLYEILARYPELCEDLIPNILQELCFSKHLKLAPVEKTIWNIMDGKPFSVCNVLKSVITNNVIEFNDLMSYFIYNDDILDSNNTFLKLALEEAFYINEPKLFQPLLDNGIPTTPYCLFFAMFHQNNEPLMEQILNQMSSLDKKRQIQYLHMLLSLCCKNGDIKKLRKYIRNGIRPTHEHLYESVVIFENEKIGHFILDDLLERRVLNPDNYWTLSLLNDTS